MIVLKEGSLSTVWKEVNALLKVNSDESELSQKWQGRDQYIQWVNKIEYNYGTN